MRIVMPDSLSDAYVLLEKLGNRAIPIAGGTDLLVNWPQRAADDDTTYVDLSRLGELKGHRWTDVALILCGLTTYWDLIQDERARAEFPILIDAARQVGAIQIQTRGTWAGNIVNASPAADGVPVLMACDAVVVLGSAAGRTEVPLCEFYLGYKSMQRTPEQLIEQIRIPRRTYDVQTFEKVGSRSAQTIAKVGLAITHCDLGWRIVAASMAPTVRRCPSVEAMLDAKEPLRSPDDLLPAIRADVSPIDDIRSTAHYREQVMARVLFHAVTGNLPAAADAH